MLRAFVSGISQLRIDVALPDVDVEQELDALHAEVSLRTLGAGDS
jgi:hypothetical protein